MKRSWLFGTPLYALVDADGTIIADDDDFRRGQPTILEALRAHGVCKPQGAVNELTGE